MTALKFNTEHALDFFQAIYLDVPGLIWVGGFEPRKFGAFFSTDEEGLQAAVRYAAQMDLASRPKGIYFRCTTLEHPLDHGKRGGNDDTFNVPVFWSDNDFGEEGHKRKDGQLPNPPDQESAYALFAEAGLPEPTILIHSGGGLYGIWRNTGWYSLDKAAEISGLIQDWLEHASNQHGWGYGAGVRDLARVLRLPGSINRKNPANERPCRVIGGSGTPIHGSCWPKEAPEKPRTATTSLPPRRTTPYVGTGTSVFDALDQADWADILEPADWTYVGTDSAGELWMRPGGADSAYSARVLNINPHVLVVHSASTDLPSGEGRRLTKARVFAHLHHGGDLSEAAKDLIKAANDNGGTAAANGLPSGVLDAIKTASDWCPENWVKPTVIEFMAGGSGKPGEVAEQGPVPDFSQLELFLATYTRFARPDRLGRRVAWMCGDSASRLPVHARHLVNGVLEGHYPATRALDALGRAARHHGLTQPDAPRWLLAAALDAATTPETAA